MKFLTRLLSTIEKYESWLFYRMPKRIQSPTAQVTLSRSEILTSSLPESSPWKIIIHIHTYIHTHISNISILTNLQRTPLKIRKNRNITDMKKMSPWFGLRWRFVRIEILLTWRKYLLDLFIYTYDTDIKGTHSW